MITRFYGPFRRVTLFAFAVGLVIQIHAQLPAEVEINLYAGLTITGEVGDVYSVQYTTNLTETNAWLVLTNLLLPQSHFLWVDTSVPAVQRRYYRVVPSTIIGVPPTNFVWIPPGTFIMGSPTNELGRSEVEDESQHTVTLSKGYFMAKHEVTQSEYLTVVGINPSFFTPAHGFTQDLNRPVDTVNWHAATNYCALLNQREQQAGRLPLGWAYRLPTEAEWENACRAGTTTPFHHGPDLLSGMENFDGRGEYVSGIGDISNASGVHLDKTVTVGSYQPNAFGLYDMHGNVREWCRDIYASYPTNVVVDPQGPSLGPYRVFRGGAWIDRAKLCRSAERRFDVPEVGNSIFGFRVVLAPIGP